MFQRVETTNQSRCPEHSVLDLFWLTTFFLTTSWRKWRVERLTAAFAHFVDLMQQLGDMATLKHAANLGGVVCCVFPRFHQLRLTRVTVCCNYCWSSYTTDFCLCFFCLQQQSVMIDTFAWLDTGYSYDLKHAQLIINHCNDLQWPPGQYCSG